MPPRWLRCSVFPRTMLGAPGIPLPQTATRNRKQRTIKPIRTYLLFVCLWPLLSLTREAVAADQPVAWFSTGGETIHHLRAGRTSAKTPRSIIAAAYSGKVMCFDFAGKKLWEQTACRDFPFEPRRR